ncbi:cytochrome P450 [Dichomitus squalens]|uniref:Cytochrome P450 n=1 Tax=Dichomitus squalens TaxID=114155 RepID=A0A4Q9MH81_9APHY|nr:cytochrome P450 [Dichomitus squalens]
MTLVVWIGTLLGAFVLWQLVGRRSAPNGLATVAGPQRERWLTGNFHRLFKDGLEYNLGLIRQYGGVVKVYGPLGAQQLLVSDPRALHHVVVKDQDVYHETDMFLMTNHLIFGEGLIATVGEQHKKQRKMLNPVFSLANMRAVLPTVAPIANKLLERIQAQLPEGGGTAEIDVLPWAGRVTMDLLGGAVLGISLDALDPEKTKEHALTIRKVSRAALKVLVLRPFIPMAVRNFSLYWRNKMVDWLPWPALREMRELSRTLDRCARNVFHEKKDELENGITNDYDGPRRSLMTIMLEANQSGSEKERLTDEELIGQINTLLIGGDTVTTAVARVFWILAREQGAQARLRSEIKKAKMAIAVDDGMEDEWEKVPLSYDTLVSLPYLDAVVRETLRLYPPTSLINRVATKDSVLPLQDPIRTTAGEETTAVHVPAGTNIIISILGSNHNKRIWGDDADQWRPERWLTASGERIGWGKNVDLAFDDDAEGHVAEGTPGYRNGVKYPGVYATMMTFLGGSRACIGFKFAEMELKQVLATLISSLHFSLPSATNEDGVRKEIYWRMDGLQVPVVLPPHGDGKSPSVPLDVRAARETDFL